jgi:hypothetical protein
VLDRPCGNMPPGKHRVCRALRSSFHSARANPEHMAQVRGLPVGRPRRGVFFKITHRLISSGRKRSVDYKQAQRYAPPESELLVKFAPCPERMVSRFPVQ